MKNYFHSINCKILNWFQCGWYAHPIFSKTGGYPDVMVENIDRRSKAEGRAFSRLPKMSDELKEYIKGMFVYNFYHARHLPRK